MLKYLALIAIVFMPFAAFADEATETVTPAVSEMTDEEMDSATAGFWREGVTLTRQFVINGVTFTYTNVNGVWTVVSN